IAPGTYQGGLHFNGLHGEEGKPIILAAADKENPPVLKGRNSCIHLTDPAYVELHNLVLTEATSNGINIDDGGSYDSPAHHVVLRGLTIRDVGPNGNCDGIKLSGLDKFRVEDCMIERWGDGGSAIDMVGCHDGEVTGCTFRYVVRILQESRGNQFVPRRNGVFSNNIIAFRSDETRAIANIGPGTGPDTFKFAGNHWYCIDRPERSDRFSLPVKETGGSYGADPQFVDAESGDLRLRAIGPVRNAGARVDDSR
ncbi:MAG: hypothetical protein ACC628_28175, partial [Pirellulaceae bacterium]